MLRDRERGRNGLDLHQANKSQTLMRAHRPYTKLQGYDWELTKDLSQGSPGKI